MTWVQPVVEDLIQERIILKLFRQLRPEVKVMNALGKNGNTYIRKKLAGFNEAAKYIPHVVLTDLDNIDCPPELINNWVNFPLQPNLLFRIAVREAEAWLLADRKGFANYMSIPINKIPTDSETIADPKEFIVGLAKKSRKHAVKNDVVPYGTAKVGPGYNLRMEEFIVKQWNVREAGKHSESLSKAMKRINDFLK